MGKRISPYLVVPLIALISISFRSDVVSFQDQIAKSFENYLSKSLEEKLYIQTDKPYYSAGENIWFNGFVVNAAILKPVSLSNFIYVELISRNDSVVYRVKVCKKDGSFAGYIKLKPGLSPGYYTFRAYTNWMKNNSPDFFFTKSLYIGNQIDDRVKYNASYGEPKNGQLLVNLYFSNQNQEPIADTRILIQTQPDGLKKKKLWVKTNMDGKVSFEAPYDTIDLKQNVFDLSIDQDSIKYKTTLYLPGFGSDFDVQFFPEGGVFLDSCNQFIAFKAIGTDGLSVNVNGKVYSSNNEELTGLKSINKGMGKFMINTKPGESYYAIIKSDMDIEKRFDLPKTQAEGVSVSLISNRGRFLFVINQQFKNDPKPLYLLIHSNGVVYAMQPITTSVVQIPETILGAGICTFSVLDSLGNTLCERLFFENKYDAPSITMTTNKESYERRDQVDLTFDLKTAEGKPLSGNYSVSVTDNQYVKLDSLNDHILSYLLLSSDIKGHIEEPASYFTGDENSCRDNLDLLMMTQAWRRYNTSDIAKGNFKSPDNYFELGQTLSGKVINVFGKPPKQCDVFTLTSKIFRKSETDSLGRYLIDGIEFQDSTVIILKAKNRKGITDVELVPDMDVFPEPKSNIVVPRMEQKVEPPDEYFDQAKQKYYVEGGMRMIYIEEIKVTAPKIENETQHKEYYSGFADVEINSETFDRAPNINIMNWLSTIAGIQVNGSTLSIRGSVGVPSQSERGRAPWEPYILIDGIESCSEDLFYLSTFYIEKVEIFKGSRAAIFGSKGGNGAIAVTLKKGNLVKKQLASPSMAKYVPLGLQKPEQFYVPKYDVQSIREDLKPDLRTTIYWNPSLSSDSTGIAKLQFYTADQLHNYSVVLEGVSNEGEICRYVGQIELK